LAPRKPNSIPPLKPIHFEKKLFSAAPKDSLQRTVNYRYRTLIYELWVIDKLTNSKLNNFFCLLSVPFFAKTDKNFQPICIILVVL
jgi:hypothetical protein